MSDGLPSEVRNDPRAQELLEQGWKIEAKAEPNAVLTIAGDERGLPRDLFVVRITATHLRHSPESWFGLARRVEGKP
jgi:hypothetical protein